MTLQGQYTIVIAESARIALEIESTFLRRRGFKVLTTEDGPTALSLAVSERPDVVILDQTMRSLLGSEICVRLKDRPETRKLHVVILVEREDQTALAAARAAGADLLFEKSKGREALLEAVSELLGIPARKSARIVVAFLVVMSFGERDTIGKAVDLSAGGICLELNRSYEMGSAFYLLKFILPEQRREIQAQARIRWRKEMPPGTFTTGMEFIEMTPEDRSDLMTYIDGRLLGM